ncbi:MAG: hypothetical protein ACREIK_06175 [Nitrospiraceae bacterium]
MTIIRMGAVLLFAATAAFTGACATPDTESSGPGAPPAEAPSAPARGAGAAASGTQGDSLQACLSRIPQDASAGQRLIAQGSCERDQADRKEIDIVPGGR